ncbi:MAG: thiamine-phosphate kinase [Chthoniobacterales bacterium]
MKLGDVGEDRLLAKLAASLPTNRAVVAGVGDDCALTRFPASDRLLVLKTDCVVEGVHFTSATDGMHIGWKAMARPLSDFAAAAAVPQFAMITLIAPATAEVARVTAIYRGLTKAAGRFDVAIVGGEMSATSGPLSLSVGVTGFIEAERRIGRNGARVGDDLFVTGTLGGSIRKKHLTFVPRIAEARWLTSAFRLHAMMDLSDGLGADLPRLARASNVDFEIDEAALPRTRGCSVEDAMSGGEDYELLFATAPRDSERLQNAWRKKFPTLPLTRIGRISPKSKIRNRKLPRGYVHFA